MKISAKNPIHSKPPFALVFFLSRPTMAMPISGTRHLTRALLSSATVLASPRSPSSCLVAVGTRLGCLTRFVSIRCRANRSGSAYSPLNSGSNFSDRPPTEMAPLFPGCDYEHWLIVMDKPGGEGATKQQMIDCYIQSLAKVVGR